MGWNTLSPKSYFLQWDVESEQMFSKAWTASGYFPDVIWTIHPSLLNIAVRRIENNIRYFFRKFIFMLLVFIIMFSITIIKKFKTYICVIFWPSTRPKNAIPRWCTGRRWHIPMAVMRGNRVSGNWLMKWDELKKFPWYTHRLMHRKRVTSELHDSNFRLMKIKHSISKIEWASNDYITELS